MKKGIPAILMASAMAGCAAPAPQPAPPPQPVALYFKQRDADSDFYPTRMLVTPAYLRIDGGKDDAGDFILLDRAARTIYSVNKTDRTVLVIKPLPVTLAAPTPFNNTVKEEAGAYPEVGGRPVRHYVLSTNGRQCDEVFAADGFLPDAAAALREYMQVLAGEQAAAAANAPPGVESACDLADNVFVPDRTLAYGFPVRQQDATGRIRQLVNYDVHFTPDPKLFVLPPDYRRYTTGQERTGG